MFIHQLVKQSNENGENDTFDQLQFIVSTFLKHEIPSSQIGMNNLIVNTSKKIHELKFAAEYHRQHIDMYTSIGIFHQEAYEKTIKQANQLQHLLDIFLTMHNEEERQRTNHRMKFVKDKIEKIYNEVLAVQQHKIVHEFEQKFWSALKEDLFPILLELK